MVIDELRALPLFAGVSNASLEAIAEAGDVAAEPGQVLVRAGDLPHGMFVVLEGGVLVELPGVTLELGPGDIFGELALLVEEVPRIGRVRAASASRCLCVPRELFGQLLDTEPAFTRTLLGVLAARLVEARTAR
jgi:CPA1 family monovalent cation:H+ antiporter